LLQLWSNSINDVKYNFDHDGVSIVYDMIMPTVPNAITLHQIMNNDNKSRRRLFKTKKLSVLKNPMDKNDKYDEINAQDSNNEQDVNDDHEQNENKKKIEKIKKIKKIMQSKKLTKRRKKKKLPI